MKYSNIGGQAVMEGVMMRNGEKYAVAVRTADHEIVVQQDEYHSLIKNKKILTLPIVRGVFNFVDSLVLGMKTLMFSADFFAEETEDELEERLGPRDFVRASKSAVVNFSRVQSIRPDLGGRLQLTLENGERLGVSRQYAPAIKEKLGIIEKGRKEL